MIVSETSHAGGAPISGHAQSLLKITAVVVAMFPLIMAYVLTGAATAPAAPAAATATVETVLTGNYVTSISDFHSAPCRGKKPGVCPGSLFV